MEDLTDVQTMAVLNHGEVAHMAVVSDGEPYITPISYVVLDDSLAFRTGPGRRLEALKQGSRVNVVVTEYDRDTGGWSSAMVWGAPQILQDGAQKEKAVSLMLAKYRDVLGSPLSFSAFSPVGGLTDVVCVAIDEISGRSSGSGLGVRTRPGRL